MKNFVISALALAASVLTGCSFPEQFAKTAGPVAEQMYLDEGRYIAALPETDANKPVIKQRADMWIAAVRSGDRPTTLASWYGNPGVRLDYTTFLYGDTKIRPETRGVLLHSVTDFDWITSIGPKTVSPPTTAPAAPSFSASR